MDWIDKFIEKWKSRLVNLSLQKAMIIYLVIAILLTVFASAVTLQLCDSWQNTIREVNSINEDSRYVGDGAFVMYYRHDSTVVIGRQDVQLLAERDTWFWKILSVVKILCIPVYSLGAIFLVSTLYYKNKLKEPIFLLKKEMESIKRNDLSFSCFYDSADEMGDICKTMDSMRKTVIDNQQNMWDLMEEQRKINAAFAHDLRTPLTVISGYVDMLAEYYPKGKVSDEKMLEIFSSIQSQISRMRNFSKTMKEIDSFEVLEVRKKRKELTELERDIQNFVHGLENDTALKISVSIQAAEPEIYCDENIIMEVLGNLLSNALRYGREKIEILIEQREKSLFLYVKDDGRGMTKEELYKADSPYYSDKTKTEEIHKEGVGKTGQNTHFGLGLTICKILCKKHGGGISFSNSMEGGAIVCAEFFVG
ncbi:MAG: HAMP domain-containing histidine kinase [Lachnospiraceae bacterium]|nr:HAMP domain-containing histidine kinase [Lachnospiraceae bacterium]